MCAEAEILDDRRANQRKAIAGRLINRGSMFINENRCYSIFASFLLIKLIRHADDAKRPSFKKAKAKRQALF